MVTGTFATSVKVVLITSSCRRRTAAKILAAVAVRGACTVHLNMMQGTSTLRLMITTTAIRPRYALSQGK